MSKIETEKTDSPTSIEKLIGQVVIEEGERQHKQAKEKPEIVEILARIRKKFLAEAARIQEEELQQQKAV